MYSGTDGWSRQCSNSYLYPSSDNPNLPSPLMTIKNDLINFRFHNDVESPLLDVVGNSYQMPSSESAK